MIAFARVLARTVGLLTPAVVMACGSAGASPYSLDVGTDDAGDGSFVGGDASGGGPLDAHIEVHHVTVSFVTVSCAGPCADVVAVPTGGQAPYTFAWEDGSTNPARHVCPTSKTSYLVKVTDTGSSGEFSRAAQTVQAPLTADVISCPDGRRPDVCISNPSFEGIPGPSPSQSTDIGAPPWVGCTPSSASFVSAGLVLGGSSSLTGTLPAATDGATYLLLDAFNPSSGAMYLFNLQNGAVSGPLCETMHAGTTYSLMVDLASYESYADTARVSLQILGGTSSCGPGERLWTSPLAGTTFGTYCATFTPTRETTFLGLAAISEADAGPAGQLLVDHIVPVAACP
jgi:hypothetical protein